MNLNVVHTEFNIVYFNICNYYGVYEIFSRGISLINGAKRFLFICSFMCDFIKEVLTKQDSKKKRLQEREITKDIEKSNPLMTSRCKNNKHIYSKVTTL